MKVEAGGAPLSRGSLTCVGGWRGGVLIHVYEVRPSVGEGRSEREAREDVEGERQEAGGERSLPRWGSTPPPPGGCWKHLPQAAPTSSAVLALLRWCLALVPPPGRGAALDAPPTPTQQSLLEVARVESGLHHNAV